MSDNEHVPESHTTATAPMSSEEHPALRPEDSTATKATHEEASNEVDAHDFSATAAEPAFENQEVSAAYTIHPPTTKHFETTSNPFDEHEMNSSSIAQPADAPLLPPRPPDDHPAWTQEPEAAAQPINRSTAGGDDVHREEPTDPAIAPLKAMFPDFDDTVLHSVLESVNGSQDAAVDILLGMSDPTYVSTHHETPSQPAAANPSLDLDEQLARQLMLEDQHQEQERSQWRPAGQSWPRRNSGQGQEPYQTRQQGQPGSPGQYPQQQGERTQELKETFNQIAESGKRTFSSIVSKVKAKINEYEQSRAVPSQQQQPPEPSWGASSGSRRSQDNLQQQPAGYPSYYSPDSQAAPTQPPRPSNGGTMDRHATSRAYAQYYTVGEDEDDGWTPVGNKDRPQEPPVAGSREVKGYDIGDSPEIPSISTYSPSIPSVADSMPSPDPSTTTTSAEVPRPPQTMVGSPINAAKLGLLPKRPVNLMSSQPTTPTPRHPDDDDDDELDYVENPFEEHRK